MEKKEPKINEVLSTIQKQLIAPKNKENTFAGFKFRSAESILDAVKGLLPDGYYVVCTDEQIFESGNHLFVESVAKLVNKSTSIEAKCAVPIDFTKNTKNGDSQHGGSASSYARKYALQGLFAISDPGDDPDSKDNSVVTADKLPAKPELPWLNEPSLGAAIKAVRGGQYKAEDVKLKYRVSGANWTLLEAAERESGMNG